MNAIRPTTSARALHRVTPPTAQFRRRSRRHPHRPVAVESLVKLAVNSVLAIAAFSALSQLISYNFSYQEKLQTLKTEVDALDHRVNNLEADFARNFDPQQARSIMQEQSNRVAPDQIRVILVEPAHADNAATAR